VLLRACVASRIYCIYLACMISWRIYEHGTNLCALGSWTSGQCLAGGFHTALNE
jgi:hypothetical protein